MFHVNTSPPARQGLSPGKAVSTGSSPSYSLQTSHRMISANNSNATSSQNKTSPPSDNSYQVRGSPDVAILDFYRSDEEEESPYVPSRRSRLSPSPSPVGSGPHPLNRVGSYSSMGRSPSQGRPGNDDQLMFLEDLMTNIEEVSTLRANARRSISLGRAEMTDTTSSDDDTTNSSEAGSLSPDITGSIADIKKRIQRVTVGDSPEVTRDTFTPYTPSQQFYGNPSPQASPSMLTSERRQQTPMLSLPPRAPTSTPQSMVRELLVHECEAGPAQDEDSSEDEPQPRDPSESFSKNIPRSVSRGMSPPPADRVERVLPFSNHSAGSSPENQQDSSPDPEPVMLDISHKRGTQVFTETLRAPSRRRSVSPEFSAEVNWDKMSQEPKNSKQVDRNSIPTSVPAKKRDSFARRNSSFSPLSVSVSPMSDRDASASVHSPSVRRSMSPNSFRVDTREPSKVPYSQRSFSRSPARSQPSGTVRRSSSEERVERSPSQEATVTVTPRNRDGRRAADMPFISLTPFLHPQASTAIEVEISPGTSALLEVRPQETPEKAVMRFILDYGLDAEKVLAPLTSFVQSHLGMEASTRRSPAKEESSHHSFESHATFLGIARPNVSRTSGLKPKGQPVKRSPNGKVNISAVHIDVSDSPDEPSVRPTTRGRQPRPTSSRLSGPTQQRSHSGEQPARTLSQLAKETVSSRLRKEAVERRLDDMQSAKLDEQSMNLSVMSHSTEARSSSAKGTRRRSYSTPSLPLREPIPTRTSLLREQQNANKRRSSSQSSSRSRSGSVEKKARQQPSRNTVLRQRTPSPASGNKKKANPPGARAGLLRPNKKEEVVEPLWKKALQLTQSQLNQNTNRTTQKSKPVHKEDRDVFLANQQQKFSRLEQLWEYHQGYTDKIKEDSMNSANHARPRSRSADREKKVRFIDPVISHSPSADLTDDADWSLHSNSIVSGKTRQPVKDSSNEMREVPQLKSQKGRTFLRTVNPNVVLNSSYPPKSDHSGLEDSVSPILMPPARSNFLKRQIEQYQQELQFSSATTSLSKSKQ